MYIYTSYIYIYIYIYIPRCVQFSRFTGYIHPDPQPVFLVELFLVHGPWGEAIVWHGRVGDLLGEHLKGVHFSRIRLLEQFMISLSFNWCLHSWKIQEFYGSVDSFDEICRCNYGVESNNDVDIGSGIV